MYPYVFHKTSIEQRLSYIKLFPRESSAVWHIDVGHRIEKQENTAVRGRNSMNENENAIWQTRFITT